MQTFRLLSNHFFIESEPTEQERRDNMNYALDHTEETARKYYQIIKESSKTVPSFMNDLRCPPTHITSESESSEEEEEEMDQDVEQDDQEETPLQRRVGNHVSTSLMQRGASATTGSSDGTRSVVISSGKQIQDSSSDSESESQEERPLQPEVGNKAFKSSSKPLSRDPATSNHRVENRTSWNEEEEEREEEMMQVSEPQRIYTMELPSSTSQMPLGILSRLSARMGASRRRLSH